MCRPARLPRSSAARRCWRWWRWRCRRAARCAPGRSRRSGWANRHIPCSTVVDPESRHRRGSGSDTCPNGHEPTAPRRVNLAMRHLRVVLPTAIAVAACAAGAAPPVGATWTNLPSQAIGSGSALDDADALSATAAWAVGGNGDGIVERYDGTSWKAVATPTLLSSPTSWAMLHGVDAVSAASALAVGEANGAAAALGWNGSSWSKVSVATPSGSSSALNAVKAFSATDAWAVGRVVPSFNGLTLIERWQGSSWKQVASQSPGTRDNTLSDVAGTAPNDIWAVGYSRDLPYGNRARHSLIEHYDGNAWSRVPSPDLDTQTVLDGVAALSSTDAWAVGYASNKGAVVMRYDGHSWTASTLSQLSSLTAVAALSSSDIWAAGSDAAGNAALANWRGSGWTITPAPVQTGTGTPSLTGL